MSYQRAIHLRYTLSIRKEVWTRYQASLSLQLAILKNEDVSIYVIDDDVEVGTILYLLLRTEGFMVDKFLSGREAIHKMSLKLPDLVLLDFMLPGENVENLIPLFRKKGGKDLPIILMSASHDAAKAAKNYNVQDFLAKPFAREDIINSIHKVID